MQLIYCQILIKLCVILFILLDMTQLCRFKPYILFSKIGEYIIYEKYNV
jgi:hypothetical protein